jgi:NAD(P)-dependent dehydrogenase (short-subunit alcohol dehydrogenase family)
VNNAGQLITNEISEPSSIDVYDKLMDINVRSVIALTQAAIPHLITSKGCIVNISSDAAVKAIATLGFYCMSKVALDHFTRCLAVELGPQGVRVNTVRYYFFLFSVSFLSI